jgi:hypothetical protein
VDDDETSVDAKDSETANRPSAKSSIRFKQESMLLAVGPLGAQLSLNSGSATSVGVSRKSAQPAL